MTPRLRRILAWLAGALLALAGAVAGIEALRRRGLELRRPPAPVPPLPPKEQVSPAARALEQEAAVAHAERSGELKEVATGGETAEGRADAVLGALEERRRRHGGKAGVFLALSLVAATAHARPPVCEPAALPAGPASPEECAQSARLRLGLLPDGSPPACTGILTPAWQAARDAAVYDEAECLRAYTVALERDRDDNYALAKQYHGETAAAREGEARALRDAEDARAARVWWAAGGAVATIASVGLTVLLVREVQ